MAEPYMPFDRLYPYEKRPPQPPGDEELLREHDDDIWGESPLDRLYRRGFWYYFPPLIQA